MTPNSKSFLPCLGWQLSLWGKSLDLYGVGEAGKGAYILIRLGWTLCEPMTWWEINIILWAVRYVPYLALHSKEPVIFPKVSLKAKVYYFHWVTCLAIFPSLKLWCGIRRMGDAVVRPLWSHFALLRSLLLHKELLLVLWFLSKPSQSKLRGRKTYLVFELDSR